MASEKSEIGTTEVSGGGADRQSGPSLPTEKKLARQLRGWRRVKGMTLREAAQFSRVPLATYHRAERGIGHLTASHYRTLVLMLEKDLLAGRME